MPLFSSQGNRAVLGRRDMLFGRGQRELLTRVDSCFSPMLVMKMLSHLNRDSLLILCQLCITTGFLICTLTCEEAWQGRTPLHVR
jgi:hypothetical protein